MLLNVVVLAVAVLLATLIGLAVRRSSGHFRAAAAGSADAPGHGHGHDHDHEHGSGERLRLEHADLGDRLGERATLLQFSSAFCAPCRATRRVLADVAELVPGVRHVEVDAESNLELVRRLGVRRTPTTFLLDASGNVVTRSSGAPTKAGVLAALGVAVAERPAL